MKALDGKVAWITGAGSGIGEATALALAAAGAKVILTGRRIEPLQAVAARIASSGGTAVDEPGDLTDKATAATIAERIRVRFGRLDILVNNAGTNITQRRWDQVTPDGIDAVLKANLSATFYCAAAVLPLMRANGGGVLVHTASWAGKFINPVAGGAYTAAKHAVIAMSHTLNMEEYVHGIRSTALIPAEVATPILETRANPPNAEARALMLQPSDLAELILFISTRPAHVCLNEVVVSPTANGLYAL